MPGPEAQATRRQADAESRYGTLVFSIDGASLAAVRRMAVASGAVELMRCSPQYGSARFWIQMIVPLQGLAAVMESIGAFAAKDGHLLHDLSCSCGRRH